MGNLSARELVMTYGWNATAYQTLNPGLRHWFAAGVPAVVAYTRRQNTMLVAGAPVCGADALRTVGAQFERFAGQQGCRVCYVCAAERLRDLMADSDAHATVVIGAQPVWHPQEWPALIASRRSLRAQLARARNKGVMIESIPCSQAINNAELDHVREEWLHARGLPPLHFMVEPRVLRSGGGDRVVFAARPFTVLIFAALTVFLGYEASRLSISADFDKTFDGLVKEFMKMGGSLIEQEKALAYQAQMAEKAAAAKD